MSNEDNRFEVKDTLIINRQLVGWLGFTACQPIGLFYAEYVFINKLTFFLWTQFFLQTQFFL